MKLIDLSGLKFGRWTVLKEAAPQNTSTMWECRCDCGTIKAVNGKSIRRGLSTSCGCYNTEKARNQGTHRQSGRENGNKETAEYRIWSGMRKRCTNPRAQRFDRYGGRGISICEKWSDFQQFFKDMGPRPTPRHSIERVDNDGNYCPENCRWATPEEQANNNSRNIIVLVEGVKMTLAAASDALGISYSSAYRRLKSGKLPKA